ncbi:OmpH family outer membrane protein [Acidimangrovimonas sediminis]|uniref:OmpH family outer membrane protein n=1 Tax=Acidimangrovimonas sediminis TaxID=2056283 RepID=UPI000C80B975|nr:OmpH family outer membrane protein [Acidimangrovimonas sediminis]
MAERIHRGAFRFRKGAATAALFALAGVLVLTAGAATPAAAQVANYSMGQPVDGDNAAPQTPVLTLDQDRMFSQSDFGKRVARSVQDAQAQLLAENRRMEAGLSAEEKTLTEERKTMAPDKFRKLADDFDTKVQKIRHDQDAKNRIIQAWRTAERQRFYEAALPVLGRLVRDSGAVAILNSQAVFLSFKTIDVTDRAIERLNESLGDGAKGAPKLDLSAKPPPAQGPGSGSGGVQLPKEVTIPGVGQAVAPNGAVPQTDAGGETTADPTAGDGGAPAGKGN